jgi:hypothetical protein
MLKIDGGGAAFEAALSPLAASYFSACAHEASLFSP